MNHVSLPRDRKSRQFMGYGFVEFSSAAEAKKALTLSGHTEPSWESSLVVMSKAAWEQRKRDRHNAVTPLSTEDAPVPLYVSHIPSDATVKSIRNLFCMFGPVLHVSLWSAESSLLVENTCIVEFTCSLVMICGLCDVVCRAMHVLLEALQAVHDSWRVGAGTTANRVRGESLSVIEHSRDSTERETFWWC